MNKLANHTTLKEWANVIEALGRGEQVILIRKGGIADPRFGVEAERFYLYPTYFHQPGASDEPRTVTITHWAEVVKTWRVSDVETLYRLAPLVVMPRETLDARYRFRPDQALYVIAVRAYALAQPRTIAVTPAYVGCRSWVSIDDEIDVDGSLAVLSEAELSQRIAAIENAIMRSPSPATA
jgi:hypothetical protein